MEQWFIFAALSALFGGFQMFTYKVAAERDYDASLINTYAAILSALILFGVALFISDSFTLSTYILIFLFIMAALFMFGNIVRNAALQVIDTAIFYPLYKVLSPLLVIIAGLYVFNETFTAVEWVGLVFSLLVPVLLITNAEKFRQRDLARGLKLVLLASVLAAGAALISKEMAEETTSIWFLIAVGDLLIAVVGVTIFLIRNRRAGVLERMRVSTSMSMLALAGWMGVLQATSFAFLMFAFREGPVGIVYTINSLYILIPIVLAAIFYSEHWNTRKVAAVALSVAALALLQ